ncbi:hypothetical protein LY78DRAFT_661092 [Colletotrichum sublineola]|nr:hypothetical protein LY78DRAFT_661092 [Colletotrichum sublineola]
MRLGGSFFPPIGRILMGRSGRARLSVQQGLCASPRGTYPIGGAVTTSSGVYFVPVAPGKELAG